MSLALESHQHVSIHSDGDGAVSQKNTFELGARDMAGPQCTCVCVSIAMCDTCSCGVVARGRLDKDFN